MRKIVLLIGILLLCLNVFGQSLDTNLLKDTTSLKYITVSCYGAPVLDSISSPVLALFPSRRYTSNTRNAWNKKAPFSLSVYSQDGAIETQINVITANDKADTILAYKKFNDFNTEVLKGNIKKEAAKKVIKELIDYIHHALFTRSEVRMGQLDWVFPIKGYKSNAIGGTNGNGYSDKGYHYLDGNKHTAHPAHDIFINDKNQDCIDDLTSKPADVLTVDDGIVIACSNEWEPASNLRGGKYIWIYHQQQDIFTYYAHNNAIFVKPGDHVVPGQKIAEVGRTGYNAFKKRSPTHLHFSAFRLVGGVPVPFNPYAQLKKAKTL
jgi:murein DD-endopeptidase MepM/ murein hydrolase activator NlpD